MDKITEFYFEAIEENTDTLVQENQDKKLLGHYLRSTASATVEDSVELPTQSVNESIRKIALHLLDSEEAEIIIAIHGYATSLKDVKQRYRKICNYGNEVLQSRSINYAFLGYCWGIATPTAIFNSLSIFPLSCLIDKLRRLLENPFIKPIINIVNTIRIALRPLPIFPTAIFITGLMICVITSLLILVKNSNFGIINILTMSALIAIITVITLVEIKDLYVLLLVVLFTISLVIPAILVLQSISLAIFHFDLILISFLFMSVIFCTIVFTLILLRVSAYFVDSYRGANYGVLDLVKLVRQLDKSLFDANFLRSFATENIQE